MPQQQPGQQPMNPMMQQQGAYQMQNQMRVMGPQGQQMPAQPYVCPLLISALIKELYLSIHG